MPMNDVTDEVKSEDNGSDELQQTSGKIVVDDASSVITTPILGVQQTKHDPLGNPKDDDDNKEKDVDPPTEDDEAFNTVRLLGEPLASQGPYTFYSALAYRKQSDVTKKKRQRLKNQKLENTTGDDENTTATKTCDSSSSCCCSEDAGNNFCTCDDGSSSCSLSTSCSEWSVVHMNHFYAVRPWYSKRNSSTSDRQQQLKRRRHQRKNSPKLATSTSAERRQHHYQQSVCIGELELLWRDDSVATTTMVSSSLLKKRNSNKVVLPSLTAISNGSSEGTDSMTNINSHGDTAVSSDDDDGGGGNDDSSSLLPRRRTLPRRTRQPSAKKLEAAESYAAAVAAAAEETSENPLQQSPHRSRFSTSVLTDPDSVGVPLSSPNAQYRNGNVLCSVRLYVMPDQTAAGRLGGVHGEDEVLEINTWGASCSGDRWPSNAFINGGNSVGSIYNGGGGVDDYGYGSGSHSSGTLPSGCSGLVLRAEDFVEWVRGGLMNDDEYEDTESDSESLESECDDSFNERELIKTESLKKEEEQQLKYNPSTTDVNNKVEQWQEEKLDMGHDDEKNKVKTDNSVIEDVVKKENLVTVNMDKLKIEQEVTVDADLGETNNKENKKEKLDDDNNIYYSKSAVDEVLEAERIPLAAARIHPRQGANQRHRNHCHRQHRRLNSESLINGEGSCKMSMKHNYLHNEITTRVNKADNDYANNQKCNCYCCKRRRRSYQSNNKKTKIYNSGSSSYKQRLVVMSYSRYCRYRAQLQRRQEEQLKIIEVDNETTVASKTQGVDTMNTTRVLFCRDTYDYPAELLLEPFNAQHGQQQNTTVLVNHMAPKLKGWPAHPASWMSFRWNRVRRRLRHLEHGNGGNEDRRRRRRRKLKKKCHQRQNGASGGAMIMTYSSSTDDDDSDNSDSDDASSANDAATNSTTTASTSDSDGAPPVSSATSKTSNKNLSAATTKVNGGVHQNNKKTLSAPAASNMIIINGATERTSTVNKRSAAAVGQLGQQPTKRSRIVYAIGGQPQNQQIQQRRVVYQQQQQQHPKPRQLQQQQQFNQRSRQTEQFNQLTQAQRNHHMLVQQQQQRLQSLNRRLPTPISSIQSATTRIIHHHLPPSVTIMPVAVPASSTAIHQQQQRNNNRLPNRQKQYSPATIISTTPQRQNNNSNRQSNSLPPVIFKYEDDVNQEYGSNDKNRYTNTTVTAAMAACQRRVERHNFEDEQKQQREEEERQRRWLVNALRLGGLEVTAVPLKVNASGGNSSDDKDISTVTTATSQQQRGLRHFRQRSVSFQSLPVDNANNNSGVVIRNEHHDGHDDSNLDSDSDSVIMTVTPDVICLLNKSQQQMQESPEDNFSSTSSGTIAHPLQPQRQSTKTNNDNSNSGHKQHPVTVAAETTNPLHDQISRAMYSFKHREPHMPNTAVPVSSNSKNMLIIDGSNHQHSNNNNNRQQQRLVKNSGVIGFRQQQTLPIIDRSPKQLVIPNTSITATPRQQKHLSQSTVNSSQQQQQLQQHRKGHLPFSSISMVGSSTANLEITLVPTTSCNTNSTKLLSHQQQKRNSSLAAPNNSLGGSENLSVACSSSSMSVKQLLRRNTPGVSTNTSSLSIIETLSNNKNRQHLQRNSSKCIPVTAKASSQQQQQQQQQQQIQQLLIMATPQNQQQPQTDKRKPQQDKKD